MKALRAYQRDRRYQWLRSQVGAFAQTPQLHFWPTSASHLATKPLRDSLASHLFSIPAERVIAYARFALAILSLLTFHIVPTVPPQYSVAVVAILVVYCTYAAIIIESTTRIVFSARNQLLVHTFDIVVVAGLMLLTRSDSTPTFAFFTFMLLAAALRWNWRSVVATALVIFFLFLLAMLAERILLEPNDFTALDLRHVIVRIAFLGVAGGLLAHVSALREKGQERLARLAEWSGFEFSDLPDRSTLPQALSRISRLFEANRVLIAWSHLDEPFVHLALWDNGAYRLYSENNDNLAVSLQSDLGPWSFATEDLTSGAVRLYPHTSLASPAVSSELSARFHIRSVAGAPFRGATCYGRIYILDRTTWSDDHLLMVGIIATRIGIELDRTLLQQRAQKAAAATAKMRLVRDLHDGVLQSLAAAVLQVDLSMRCAADQSRRLSLIRQLLEQQQKQIREFVCSVRSEDNLTVQVSLAQQLKPLISQAATIWNCGTSLEVKPDEALASQALTNQLKFVVSEGIANAVRHGNAHRVEILVRKRLNCLAITIKDDGRGFGDEVEKECATRKSDMDPASIRARIQELGGCLTASGSPEGSQIAIRVPLQ